MAPKKRQRLHDTNVETPQPPLPAQGDSVHEVDKAKEAEFEELLQVYWGCPRCLCLTHRSVSCRCRYINADLENWGRKLLGWPQVTTLPSHEQCHRREEECHRYIYISAQTVIDRQEGQIITAEQMDEQDMQQRYISLPGPGFKVYDRDRNEMISKEEMAIQMAMQRSCHNRWQRYFIVQKRVYDAISNEFISLEQFKQRQDEHNSETESELPPTGQQGEGQAAVALGGQEGSNDGSEQLEHISEAGEGHERQEKC